MKIKQITILVVLALIVSMLLTACSEGLSDKGSSKGTLSDEMSDGVSNENKYAIKLSDEQAALYESAVSYIVKRDGERLYRIQYSNCGVTFSGGVLNTKYNGMGIKISGGGDDSCYPPLDMNVVEGKPLSYVGTSVLASYVETADENAYAGYRYLIEVDKISNEPVLKAMRPLDVGTDEDLFSGKYDELPDFSEHAYAVLSAGTFYELSNDEKALPIKEWNKTTNYMAYEYILSKEIKVEYEPLKGGEYYVVYEVTDVNGNTYVPDWVPYGNSDNGAEDDSDDSAVDEEVQTGMLNAEPDISVKWAKGERQQFLFEKNGLEFYISAEKDFFGDTFYALKVKNNCERKVQVKTTDLLVNDNLSLDGVCFLTVDPGKFVAESYYTNTFAFPDGMPELKDLTRVRFYVCADDEKYNSIFTDVLVSIDMTDAWPLGDASLNYFDFAHLGIDAAAKEQVVLENEELRVTLLSGGGLYSSDNSFNMMYKVENLTQEERYVSIEAATVNNVCVDIYGSAKVLGGCYTYIRSYVDNYRLKNIIEPSIETLEVLLAVRKNNSWASYSYEYYWCDVELETNGLASPLQNGEVVLEKDGIRVESFPQDDNWLLVAYNGTEDDVKIMAIIQANANTPYDRNMGSGIAGAGQYSLFMVVNDTNEDDPDGSNQMEIIFRVLNLHDENKIVMKSEKIVLKLN